MIMIKTIALLLAVAPLLPVVPPPPPPPPSSELPHATIHPEAKLFDAKSNATADVDAALARARISNKRVIAVFGGNWCHDSIGLAGWFETPRFKDMLSAKYELVYVDVGVPQTGQGRNLALAQRLGLKRIKGTPTVMILSPDGRLLNRKDAPKWRNAASRTGDAIFNHFAEF